MLRQILKRRILTRVGAVLLSASTFVAIGADARFAAADDDGNPRTAANAEKSTLAAPTPGARLVMLEFAAKDDENCKRTNSLLNEMRRKNYPIQRVERDAGGSVLFERFAVESTPTFVLLLDGKELDRCAVQDESLAVLRNQLLRLFQRGREEVAERPIAAASNVVPETSGTRAELPAADAKKVETARGQAPDEYGGFTDFASQTPSDGLARADSAFTASDVNSNVNSNVNPNAGSSANLSPGSSAASNVGFQNYSFAESSRTPSATPIPIAASSPLSPPVPVSASSPLSPPAPIAASSPLSPSVPVSASSPLSPSVPVSASSPLSPPAPIASAVPVAPPPSDLTRIVAATVRVVVSDGARSEVGTGVVVHYNADAGEALAVTCGRLFRDVQPDATTISVEIFDSESGRTVPVQGENVYCDVETDIAFVALRTPTDVALRPIPFLPQNETLAVDENVVSVARTESGAFPLEHRVLSLDRHYFQPRQDDASRRSFYYLQVANAPEKGRCGGGLFVERNGKYYLAGVCVAGDTKENDGFFLPISLVAQTLLVRESLAAVYRDQVAGKFDESAPVANAAPEILASVESAPVTNVAPESLASENAVAADFPTFDESAAAPKNVRVGREVAANSAAPPFDPAARPDGERVRSTSYEATFNASNPSVDRGSELFEAGLEALRRRGLEGAEIICIVNWSNDSASDAPRETEVVRLPRLANGAASAPDFAGVAPADPARSVAPRPVSATVPVALPPTRNAELSSGSADANYFPDGVRASSSFPDSGILR